MRKTTRTDYVLGSSEREIERLAYQHEVWLEETTALWNRAGIGIGTRVADFGCGPGFCSKALSRLVGSEGHVYSIDSSDKFARIVRSQTAGAANLTFYQCDVIETPIPDSSVDAVFARWLFCFLTEPERAIEEARRVLVPGGKVVILDYFNYLAADVFPQTRSISMLFEAFSEDVESHGGSWDIGGELPGMLLDSGFEVESLVPVTRIGPPGSRVWKWVEYFTSVSLKRILKNGIWQEDQKSEFERAWSKAAADPASFLFTPPMIGIVAVKR